MTSINSTIPANGSRKLTTNGDRYWVYSLSGIDTEIQIKTDQNTDLPHKAKTGCNFKSQFTELILKNTTGSAVDIVLIVGFGEFVDYS